MSVAVSAGFGSLSGFSGLLDFASPSADSGSLGIDLDIPVQAGSEYLVELVNECPSEAGIAGTIALFDQDSHGELCEPVSGQDVDGSSVDHFVCGSEAVAEETGTVGDS